MKSTFESLFLYNGSIPFFHRPFFNLYIWKVRFMCELFGRLIPMEPGRNWRRRESVAISRLIRECLNPFSRCYPFNKINTDTTLLYRMRRSNSHPILKSRWLRYLREQGIQLFGCFIFKVSNYAAMQHEMRQMAATKVWWGAIYGGLPKAVVKVWKLRENISSMARISGYPQM